jgi:Ca2+-binding EF-hand superfamily protein
VAGSANAFLSAILLLVIVISVFGVMFMQGLQNYIRTPDYRQDTRQSLERYFGTFSDASYTLLACITGGINWEDVSFHLKEIGALYHWFMVVYIMFAVLCVLNILNGVFVNAAIESAQSNKELAVESTYHRRMALVKQMVRWFNDADKDGSGKVSWEELRDIMQNDEVRHLLLASGIDVTSAGQIFLLLDRDKSGDLEPEEFVDNLIALQGNAQALDMAALRVVCEETSERVKEVEAVVLAHLRNFSRQGSKVSTIREVSERSPRSARPQQMFSSASPSPCAPEADDLSPGGYMSI